MIKVVLFLLLSLAKSSHQWDAVNELDVPLVHVHDDACANNTAKILRAIETMGCHQTNRDLDTRAGKAAEKDLQSLMATEFATLRSQLIQEIQNSMCAEYRTMVSGLTLKKVLGGVFHYFDSSSIKTPEDSSNWCVAHGMRLAQFHSPEQMKAVAESAPPGKWWWVGASDVTTTPGDFRWADGTRVTPDLWVAGEPNDHGAQKETCVFLDANQGHTKLRDAGCFHSAYAICQVRPKHLHCL